MILSHFGIAITPFVAALGIGGLAIGLALQDTLSNIFSGLHIIGDQPIRVHDIVEIKGQDVTGEVMDIGWRSTRIKTFTENIVVVPNNTIANSILINYEMPHQGMRAIVECGVDYTEDLAKVEKTALKVAKKIQKLPEAIPEWEPLFRYHTFANNNVNFRVILMAKSRGETFYIINEYMKALHKEFGKQNIEISWPIVKNYFMEPLQVKKK